jgi:acetone carboxylase gamma subunit
MQLRVLERVVQVHGNPNATTYTSREWVCPDCDYFEEVEEEPE